MESPQSDQRFEAHAYPHWSGLYCNVEIGLLLGRTVAPIASVRARITGNRNRLKWRTKKRFDKEAAQFLPRKTVLWPSPVPAEDAARLGLSPTGQRQPERTRGPDFFPPCASSMHALIPNIGGIVYDEARELLLRAGWQPLQQHWSFKDDPAIQDGNGPYFWAKGLHEIVASSGTGQALCVFAFRDAYENLLEVVTAGEISIEAGATPRVASWRTRDAGPT